MTKYYKIVEIRDFSSNNAIGYLKDMTLVETGKCDNISITSNSNDAMIFSYKDGISLCKITCINTSQKISVLSAKYMSTEEVIFAVNKFGFNCRETSVIDYDGFEENANYEKK